MLVTIRGQTSECDVIVGVCYTPPNQDKEADENSLRQQEKTSPP